MEIAPSDLVDFRGQRSFDMTHQLFMRQKGTFVLMFNGKIDFSVPLKYDEQDETTECKLVSDERVCYIHIIISWEKCWCWGSIGG
jgi:GTPase SAR1 family protein